MRCVCACVCRRVCVCAGACACVRILSTHCWVLRCSLGSNGSRCTHTWASCHWYNRAQTCTKGVDLQPLPQMPLTTQLWDNTGHWYKNKVPFPRWPHIQVCTCPYQGSSTGNHHQRHLLRSTWLGANRFVRCQQILRVEKGFNTLISHLAIRIKLW